MLIKKIKVPKIGNFCGILKLIARKYISMLCFDYFHKKSILRSIMRPSSWNWGNEKSTPNQFSRYHSIPTIIEKWGGSTIKNSGRQRHTLTHSSIIWLSINIYTFLNFALQFNEHYFAFLEFRMANKFHQIILLQRLILREQWYTVFLLKKLKVSHTKN